MARQRKRGIKGAGSVYQRKSDGRWVGSFLVEETGKRKSIYAETEKEAWQKLQQALHEQKQGILATGPKQKVKDYLERWFEDVHKPTVNISTYVSQRSYIYKHIIPALGHIELRKLTAQHVQKMVADKGRENLSAGTIRKIYSILHSAFDNAVKWKLVPQNVCGQVTLPPLKKRKSQILTKDQIVKLVEVANTHKMGAFIKLGLMSGMRHGEMLGLRWSDIDFEKNTLQIIHKVYYIGIPGYGFIEGDPKTENGIRKIVLPQFVADALKAHRERQQEMRQKAGSKWKGLDLVFCNRNGGYTLENANLARFRRVLKEVGLPETMRVHDLRHNVATFLINVLKYPASLVQALLGHSDIAITLGMYVETDPEMLRQMMNELNDIFGGN